MITALLWLACVLLIAAVFYWALTKLWPLAGPFGASKFGQVIYVIIIVVLALCVVFYGVIPVIESIPNAFGGGSFRPGYQR
jgi:hypothetical protein